MDNPVRSSGGISRIARCQQPLMKGNRGNPVWQDVGSSQHITRNLNFSCSFGMFKVLAVHLAHSHKRYVYAAVNKFQ